MDVIVIGGSGLVGTNLVRQFEDRGHDVLGTFRSNRAPTAAERLDKTDPAAVEALLREHDPDHVVDTAAFHAVDDCEVDRDLAWAVNAQGTRNAAAAADAVDARYVYVSTDYVFPGLPGETPYTESDPVRPPNYYGRTKYAGEQAARIATEWTVLRGSVIYGLDGDNFMTWVRGELEAGNEVGIVDDQVSRPTYAPDLAAATAAVCERGLDGLYHAGGPDSVSRYEFTVQLAESLELDRSLVSPITTDELGQDADRPADSSLDSTPLYDATGRAFRPPAAAFADVRDRSKA